MNDNDLFSFPGESTGQDDDIFGSAGFVDLGSGDDGDNPFAGMTAPAPGEESAGDAEQFQASSAVEQTAGTAPQAQSQEAPSGTEAQPQPVFQQAQPTSKAAPTSESKSQASAAPAAEEPNPLMAAMDLQDQSNARKAAAPVFAQLPVFSYDLCWN